MTSKKEKEGLLFAETYSLYISWHENLQLLIHEGRTKSLGRKYLQTCTKKQPAAENPEGKQPRLKRTAPELRDGDVPDNHKSSVFH
jgi:hypothetical protein